MITKLLTAAFLVGLIFTTTFGQTDPIDSNGLAISGYDPVAYFTGKPTIGDPSIQINVNGVTYNFSSRENQERFQANPKQYTPQYDGYCALAVSYGKKISIDPETYKIIDGKLYLFYHKKTGARKVNSLDTWNKSEMRLLKKADELWPNVSALKYNPNDGL